MNALLEYVNFQLKNGDGQVSGTIFLKINNCFHDFRNWFFRIIKMSWHAFWNKKGVAYQ
jgi:hypothetical protein